jgi:HAMP domain-containing protein
LPDTIPSVPLKTALTATMAAVALVPILLYNGLVLPRFGQAASAAQQASAWRLSAWAALLTLAVAAAAAMWLTRRLARPIRALSARAAELALRHTGRAIATDRNEMRQLQASFTAMTAALLAQFERLRSLHLDEMQNSLELQRRYALMRLLRDLSTVAHESGSLQQTLEHALEEIGGYLDWPIGRVLIVEEVHSAAQLRLRSIWFAPDRARHARFIAACEALPMDPSDRGLIGRARATGMPHWVTDLSRLDGWRRQEAASQCGLKSGFVIPVSTPGAGCAFIEFFTDHRVDASAEMVELIEAIHTELWQAGERHRGLEAAALAAAQECSGRGAGVPVTPAGTAIDAAALDNLEMMSSG